jgi:hypothetical protein
MLTLLAAAVLACQGPTAPRVVEQGGTLTIPLTGDPNFGAPLDPNARIAFGGRDFSDPQRGELVFTLVDSSGSPVGELVTRLTTAVQTHHAAPLSTRAGLSILGGVLAAFPGTEYVSIVDVPDDAPLGSWMLSITRRVGSGTSAATYPFGQYRYPITIVSRTTPTPMPTPFQSLLCTGSSCTNWSFDLATMADIVPRPEIRISLAPAVWSADVSVRFPDASMIVRDAVEVPSSLPNHAALVWHTLSAGQVAPGVREVVVSAAGQRRELGTLSVVFELKPGAAPITLEDLQVEVPKAADADGSPVATPTVTVALY